MGFLRPKGRKIVRIWRRIQIILAPVISVIVLNATLLAVSQPTQSAVALKDEPVEIVHTTEFAQKPMPPTSTSVQQADAPSKATEAAPTVQPSRVSYRPVSCVESAFQPAARIDAYSAKPGVTIVENTPSYYTFNGDENLSETLRRASQCARQQLALKGYDGVTTYSLAWAFDYQKVGDVCNVKNVRVTQHIAVLLPAADMSGLSAEATAQWSAVQGRLAAHENEHVVLDISYAQEMHKVLSLMTGSCASISKEANAAANEVAVRLQAANNLLDHATGHGMH